MGGGADVEPCSILAVRRLLLRSKACTDKVFVVTLWCHCVELN